MQTWEYQIIVQHPVTTKKIYLTPTYVWEPEIDLASFGKSGWELVSVTPIGHGPEGATSELRYYFKRRTS